MKRKTKKVLSWVLFFGMTLGSFPAIPTVSAKTKYETLVFEKKLQTSDDFEKGELEKVGMKKNKDGVELELAEGEEGFYITPEVKAPFGATHIGLHWREGSLKNENLIVAYLRVRDEGEQFGEWTQAMVEFDDRPDGRGNEEIFASLVYAEEKEYAQAKIEFISEDGKSPKLKDFTFTFLNSGEESKKISKELTLTPNANAEGVGVLKTSVGGQNVNVISREEWGAVEAYRFKDGNEDWPRSYHGTRKLIVHHTAVKGSNGETDLEKNKEAVRSTYYYHAVTQGWGDIGYNALVDAAGNVYEGRYGTHEGAIRTNPTADQIMVPDVEAGHASGYNSGSFGISAMGDFTRYAAPQAQLEGIKKVLAYVADERGIDVQGNSDFRRSDGTWHQGLNNLIGHKDATITACPGVKLYEKIQEIKNGVGSLLLHNLSGFDAVLGGVEIEGNRLQSGILDFSWTAFVDEDTYQTAFEYQYMVERVFGTTGLASDSQVWETAWFFPENELIGSVIEPTVQISAGTLQSNSNYVFYVRALYSAGNPLSTTKHVNFETGTIIITDPPMIDEIAPQVSIISPIQGGEVTGTVAITAEASDAVGVVETKFYVNGQLIGVDNEYPYSINWNSETIADGQAVISARAYDAAGNEGTSADVSVTIKNATDPEPADIEAPSIPTGINTQTISESQINLSWSASTDNIGVAGYHVYRDGLQIATTVSTSFEDKNLQASMGYSYAVSAFDAAANESILSGEVFAETFSSENLAPVVTITSPADGSLLTGIVLVTATASDADGVMNMKVFVDGVQMASKDSDTMAYNLNTKKIGLGVHVIEVTAEDGKGAIGLAQINITRIK